MCSSPEHALAYQFEPYQVVRCANCHFYYLSPRPTEQTMLELYSDDAYFEAETAGYTSYSRQADALRLTFHRLLQNLEKRGLSGGSLLEIGCGYGYLLAEAQPFFDVITGTDYSSAAVQIAGEKADRVYQGGIDQIPEFEKFDCIVATHVIEHVYRPLEFIQKLAAHLKPSGKLIIATPDMGGFWRTLMGRRWPSFKLPEHILYFDQTSLTNLLQHAGLIRVKPLPYLHAFPIPLIAEKLHITLPSAFDKFSLWLPSTTVAVYGYAHEQPSD